jgi:formate dehydrogenase subunit gamma
MVDIPTPTPALETKPVEFERLSLNQRVQHIVLIISFTTLVVTGMPLRYWNTGFARETIGLLGGIGMRSIIHRGSAIALILLCIYHIFYILFSERGARELRAMVLNLKDIKDIIRTVKFYFGLAPTLPRFGRFSFNEKFEYFAVGWGSAIMIATGLMLWFQEATLMILPKWTLDVARIVHSWEGLLAMLGILISHMYSVHWNPDVFPMSRVWLSGKISEEDMKRHHPLEYERIVSRQATKHDEQPTKTLTEVSEEPPKE